MATLQENLDALDAFAVQATTLLDNYDTIDANLEARVAAAVVVSENAALIPLANATANSLTIGALLIQLLNKDLED